MTEPAGPPQNVAAEQYVLSAMLVSLDAVRLVVPILSVGDFYRPAHALVFEAILALWDRGEPIDAVTVLGELNRRGDLAKVGGGPYLHTLMQQQATPASATYYADMVAETATMRRLVEAGQRIAQRAASGAESVEVLPWAADQVEQVGGRRAGVKHLSRSIEELMDSPDEEFDWIMPGYLERGDRMVLTGFGGSGKSTLLRQVFVCAAAGIDPFNYDRTDPIRVTVIDKENSDRQSRRRYHSLLYQAKQQTHGEFDPGNLRVGWKDGRLDLLNASDAMSLLRTIEKDKADLVYVGPYYKIHSGDPDKEDTVRRVTAILDCIVDMGAAVMIEAHPNKAARSGGNMSPSGSDAWTWWPELGFGLRLDPDPNLAWRKATLERWRGDRESDNAWPEVLSGASIWPWVESPPD